MNVSHAQHNNVLESPFRTHHVGKPATSSVSSEPPQSSKSSVSSLRSFEEALAPLLAGRTVETVFQPIVSMRRGKVIALEALSRFPDGAGKVTSPIVLFGKAEEAHLRCELDWVCLDAALRRFQSHHRLYADSLVFLNLHADTLIDDQHNALQRLSRLAEQYAIPHPNIAIELLESGVSPDNTLLLQQIVQDFKKHGFLVALDDLGIENSNLDRILLVCPDVIKADRSLIADISHEYNKQAIFRGLVQISERIGGWLVGEGVETQHDALCALDLGGDLLQGYLFGRPEPIEEINASFEGLAAPVHRTASAFKRDQVRQMQLRYDQQNEREQVAAKIVTLLAGMPRADMEAALARVIKDHPDHIASACCLDADGIQQTDALLNPHPFLPEKVVVYHPARKGDSHALKEYFYLLMESPAQPDRYESAPYVPLPTNDICITRTTRFEDEDGQTVVLCLHLRLGEQADSTLDMSQ